MSEGFHYCQEFPFVDVVVSFSGCEGCRVKCDWVQFGFLGGDCVVFTLLREYGAHAIGRCVRLKEERFIEVGLCEDGAGAHTRFEFFECFMLWFPPMPYNGL